MGVIEISARIGPGSTWRPLGEWPDLLGNVAVKVGVRETAAPLPNLTSPGICFGSLARTLDLAVCPHLSRHPLAAAAGLGWKGKARHWIQGQIREGVRNPAR